MSSICVKCGLPNDLCVCKEIAKESQKIKISIQQRKFRKKYTILEGFDKGTDTKQLAKDLKNKLACGGTSKDNRIELQGDHRTKVREALEKMGFFVEVL